MIRALDLSLAHGDAFTLQVPPLEARAGDKLAVVGPSGIGKSTFLAALAGLHRPAGGRLEVLGADLTALDAAAGRRHRAQIGLVLQAPTLLPYLDVRANLLLPLQLAGATIDAAVEARLRDLLERTGLSARANHRPAALSQGERQRAAICRALLPRPALILADEPTAGLQVDLARAMLELMFEWMGARGTLVMATHDVGLLPRFDRVIDLTGAA